MIRTLFQHLAAVAGVLLLAWYAARNLAIRGPANCVVATRVAVTDSLRHHRGAFEPACRRSYGHRKAPHREKTLFRVVAAVGKPVRVLHTDCPHATARALSAKEPSSLLGNPAFAICTAVRKMFRPSISGRSGICGSARAALLENSAAGDNRWQIHYQSSWLARSRPPAVAWVGKFRERQLSYGSRSSNRHHRVSTHSHRPPSIQLLRAMQSRSKKFAGRGRCEWTSVQERAD